MPKWPSGTQLGQVETRRLDEPDVRWQESTDISEIGRPPLACPRPPNELSLVARDVDERLVGVDVSLQVSRDHLPDHVLGTFVAPVEPRLVDILGGTHSRPASTSPRIQGTTSSSIESSEVPASKPSTSRALRTSGTRSWTSCSNGASLTYWNGRPSAWILRQMALGQFEDRRGRRGREVEVVVDRGRRFHREADAVGEVAAVGVVPDLAPVAEDVQRVLALEDLEHEVRHDVRQRELHVAAHDVGVAQGPAFADADAVERPDDRVREPVLLPRARTRSTPRRASGSRTSRPVAATSAARLRGSGRPSPTRTPSRTTRRRCARGGRRDGRRSRRRTSRPGSARSRRAGRRRTRGSS